MFGVVVQLTLDGQSENDVTTMVQELALPRAKQLAGFVSGSWLQTLEGGHGAAVMLFESEETARAAAERIRSQGPLVGDLVGLEAVDTYKVVAQA